MAFSFKINFSVVDLKTIQQLITLEKSIIMFSTSIVGMTENQSTIKSSSPGRNSVLRIFYPRRAFEKLARPIKRHSSLQKYKRFKPKRRRFDHYKNASTYWQYSFICFHSLCVERKKGSVKLHFLKNNSVAIQPVHEWQHVDGDCNISSFILLMKFDLNQVQIQCIPAPRHCNFCYAVIH